MLLRAIYILLQAAPTLEALYKWRWKGNNNSSTVEDVLVGEDEESFLDGDYQYHIETVGKKYTADAKREVLETMLETVTHSGAVSWTSPTARRFVVFVEHQVEMAVAGTKQHVANGPMLRVLHVLHLADSGRCPMLRKYDLKRRPYIGTTSMPPEESILMANLAAVVPGHLVYDPFCGTGSLLVAAAHCGAHTIGSDMDGRVMRQGTVKGAASPQMKQQRQLAFATYSPAELAKLNPEEVNLPCLTTNFVLYGLPPPSCMRFNFSTWEQGWRNSRSALLDAIVSDPPYGIREPRKKVTTQPSQESNAAFTPPVTVSPYSTHEVVLDLVLFAAEHLVIGGHLAFWHPTSDAYTDDELPRHPALQVVINIPQRISLKFLRRLVVMRKVCAVPTPRPTREACAPRQSTEDLRRLLDETNLPDNKNYSQYRERLQRRREACQQYRATHPARGNSTSRRRPSQREIVENRENNIRIRSEKQEASHAHNKQHRSTHSK